MWPAIPESTHELAFLPFAFLETIIHLAELEDPVVRPGSSVTHIHHEVAIGFRQSNAMSILEFLDPQFGKARVQLVAMR